MSATSNSSPLPRTISIWDDVQATELAARRAETPCGEGKMVWRIWGNDDGAPIVLIHGGSGSWMHWVRNIEPLVAAGRKVFVPDLPGCGDSDVPPVGHDGDALPEWIEKGAAQLLGNRAIDLVGFSFGGMVSTLMTAQYPNRVARLVLVGAPALEETSLSSMNIGLQPWTYLPKGSKRTAAHRNNLRALMLASDDAVDDLAMALYTPGLERDRLMNRRLAQTDVVLRTLPQISCPLWGIWGAEDVLYRGRFGIIEPALKLAPKFRALELIEGAGHWVQFEDAGVFNRVLGEMLGGGIRT